MKLWDDVRSKNESTCSSAATRVQRSFLMGNGDYMVVALANNRFCFKKGATRLLRRLILKLRPHISRTACTS